MIQLFFKFFSVLPLWLLHALGSLLGLVTLLVSSSYRSTFYGHLSVCLGKNISPSKRFVLCSAMHAGMSTLELPFFWRKNMQNQLGHSVWIENWECVEQAQAQGKGILFLTPHLGSFEAAAQIFATRRPITILYRPHRKQNIQRLIQQHREQVNLELAPTTLGGIRQLLKALKKKQSVGLLPDQVPALGEGVWAPMFEKPAYTMTLVGSLMRATQCQIILAVGERKPFKGTVLHLFKGPDSLPEDPVQAATQINSAMADLILKYPEQYLWGYHRYKQPKPRRTVSQNDD